MQVTNSISMIFARDVFQESHNYMCGSLRRNICIRIPLLQGYIWSKIEHWSELAVELQEY